MNGVNLEIIDLFPRSEEIRERQFSRDESLRALWRIVAAARAAVDEITAHTADLTDDERFSSGIIAEQLSAKAAELSTSIDK